MMNREATPLSRFAQRSGYRRRRGRDSSVAVALWATPFVFALEYSDI
jgi:hypothetical protein